MPYQPPPDLASASLLEIADAVAARKLPPLEQWTPAETIDSHMRIAANGQWYHQGTPITRPAMVRAFSTLLLRDEQGYWLVTPQCRQSIEVEDAPFIAIDMQIKDKALVFALNTDELVVAGPGHDLRAEGDADCPAIYLHVRHGCEARLDRSTWLQLAQYALDQGDDLHISSAGQRYSLAPSA
ncbi:DUF1285 domain-containing protein [Altericroceibacterium endophyticum]|uniref:DUF1285 domain-containing protein n=1 Tax=Altericroceibacterium endophyticum TaxID=1808508 RepID=A0A6I4T1K9_9SPHN|nr:DUF1285 domain-containing protein [Altericroceibacterium endophyticum]MXO64232.1 DUF1285 domain-containing protein [Altericroceibacterium endophyticum]